MAELYRTGKQYAEQAKDKKYEKFTYDNVDCQAFCELVLKDIGVRKPNGTVYNWKGSNDIARKLDNFIFTESSIKQPFEKFRFHYTAPSNSVSLLRISAMIDIILSWLLYCG